MIGAGTNVLEDFNVVEEWEKFWTNFFKCCELPTCFGIWQPRNETWQWTISLLWFKVCLCSHSVNQILWDHSCIIALSSSNALLHISCKLVCIGKQWSCGLCIQSSLSSLHQRLQLFLTILYFLPFPLYIFMNSCPLQSWVNKDEEKLIYISLHYMVLATTDREWR